MFGDGWFYLYNSSPVLAYQVTELNFGSVAVSQNKQITFRLTNLSTSTTLKFQWPSTSPLTFTPSVGHIKPSTHKDIIVTVKTNKPLSLKAHKVLGKFMRLSFQKPLSQVPDWDDRMKSIQWVNVPQAPPTPTVLENPSIGSMGVTSSTTITNANVPNTSAATKPTIVGPAKKKVIETEKEPHHSVIEDSQRDVELWVTLVADYCKYECPIQEICFRDTLMYQTRMYNFPLKNTGKIDLSYQWCIQDLQMSPRSETRGSENSVGLTEVPPFSISPLSGVIPPDSEAQFTVRFSPLDAIEMQSILQCQ